jgi:DNA replication and repair protein RecF
MTREAARVVLDALSLRDFRNLARLDLGFPSAGAVVVGENGQGKSNLLEAIYYLHLLRSVRGARDVDVVRFGAPGFHIAARTSGGVYHELSAGALPCVLFSPADVDLVAGAPSSRRRYLDILLALSSRPYLAALQRYRSALAQRNAALRESMRGSASRAEQRVAVWEAPLAEHGAVLWRERVRWAEQAAGRFGELCAAIGEQARVAMRYATSLEPASAETAHIVDALARALEHKRGIDMRRGITHAGPHRDDLALTLDGRELRAFGSAGQQRTAAIALRLLEAETLRERLGAAPLFLLDDPFAELDARRSAHILELLADQGMGQTLLTVPRESDIPAALSTLARWRISAGLVTHDDAHAGAA